MKHCSALNPLVGLAVFAMAVAVAGCGFSEAGDDTGVQNDVNGGVPHRSDSGTEDFMPGEPDELPVVDSEDDVDPIDDVVSHSLRVLPERLSFGQVTEGCFSQLLQACVINIGRDTVEWMGFPSPENSAFRVRNPRDLPVLLAYGEISCSDFRFSPDEAKLIESEVTIESEGLGGSLTSVALLGTGRPAPTQRDIYRRGEQGLSIYYLSKIARPETIKVFVEGTECLADGNWRFDESSNAVFFDREGTCYPAPGASIEIKYHPACLISSIVE
ncbi:MAG TPA: hypothetical protein PLC97_05150 [Myxococcota bacterium]|jgi:hypothetical protein|nr:hypothetical protein [Myxococcota bacterium]